MLLRVNMTSYAISEFPLLLECNSVPDPFEQAIRFYHHRILSHVGRSWCLNKCLDFRNKPLDLSLANLHMCLCIFF